MVDRLKPLTPTERRVAPVVAKPVAAPAAAAVERTAVFEKKSPAGAAGALSIVGSSASTSEVALDGGCKPTEYTQALVDALDKGHATDALNAIALASHAVQTDTDQTSSVGITGRRTSPDKGHARERFSMLVAQENYAGMRATTGLRADDLPGTRIDMNTIEGTLTKPSHPQKKPERYDQIDAAGFLEKASGLVDRAQKGDDVAIFFSGHGSAHEGIWMGDGSHVSPQELGALVEKAQQKGVNIGISLDACHSAVFGEARRERSVDALLAQAHERLAHATPADRPKLAAAVLELGELKSYIALKNRGALQQQEALLGGRNLAITAVITAVGGAGSTPVSVSDINARGDLLTSFSADKVKAFFGEERALLERALTQDTGFSRDQLVALNAADHQIDRALNHVADGLKR